MKVVNLLTTLSTILTHEVKPRPTTPPVRRMRLHGLHVPGVDYALRELVGNLDER
jgi:hypothetical protein